MSDQKNVMRCPHCSHVGQCVWVGYGRDWVMCELCQRRILWEEVETRWLVDDEEIWIPGGAEFAGAYH